jgi:hypothetical protein
MDVQLDVLGATMMNEVGGEVDSGDIVAEDNGCRCQQDKLAQREADEAKCTQQPHWPQHDTQLQR